MAVGQARAEYRQFLNGVSGHLKEEKGNRLPDDPKKIAAVFAARHLSRHGPTSYGSASFDFQDVMFVDMEVVLQSGKTHLRRTMVIKDRNGKRYAPPAQYVSTLLRNGRYDESESVQLFTDAYEVGSED
jgi:hypothetical protein